jgi:Protein of unknown function (DUF2971)
MEHIYRFRSTQALLEGFQELENQRIYFAAPRELKDPMEGFKDICWRGDAIVWTNLLKHYLLCLMQAVLTAIKQGPDHRFATDDIPVLLTDEALTEASRALFDGICSRFFENGEVAELPALLASRISSIRRDELFQLLLFLHFYALKIICMGISPGEPLCRIDELLRAKQDSPFRFREYLTAQKALEDKHLNSGDLFERMNFEAASIIAQTILIRDYNATSEPNGAAWNTISSAFPGMYTDQLERLLYNDWYVACFVAEPTHAAMWGIYGDGHQGACLKFRTVPNATGKPSLMLRTAVGIGGHKDAAAPIYNDVAHELYEVRYSGQYVEIDFFRSMGRLTRPQLAFWFMDSKGGTSSTGRDLMEESERWRQEYWANFHNTITTKLPDWKHESECRITLRSDIIDLSEKANRKLRYRFADLEGIIFGIKTPHQAKIEVRRIIESKCRKEGLKDFEFHQAYYSRQTGKIETSRLNLLKFK